MSGTDFGMSNDWISALLDGELDDREVCAAQRRLRADAALRGELALLRAIDALARRASAPPDVEATTWDDLWRRIELEIGADTRPLALPPAEGQRSARGILSGLLALAAALLAAFLLPALFRAQPPTAPLARSVAQRPTAALSARQVAPAPLAPAPVALAPAAAVGPDPLAADDAWKDAPRRLAVALARVGFARISALGPAALRAVTGTSAGVELPDLLEAVPTGRPLLFR